MAFFPLHKSGEKFNFCSGRPVERGKIFLHFTERRHWLGRRILQALPFILRLVSLETNVQ